MVELEEDSYPCMEMDEEESPCSPSRIQKIITKQEYEENLDIGTIWEPTYPPPNENTSSTSYTPFQALDLHDTSIRDLKEEDLAKRHTTEEDGNHKEIRSIDAFIKVDRCKLDLSYANFDCDPIYDKNTERYPIVEFWAHEQPSYSTDYE